MLISSMGRLMEELSPSSVNTLKPSRPANSAGLNQRVYAQMRRDFMVAGPFVLHSEIPELLAGSWVLVRETLFAGSADRGSKEAVAWAVSKANQCPFCVDAHFAAVQASNNKESVLASWAEATAEANAPMLSSPPFTQYYAEYLGTAVAFHYLNRMVSVFLDKKMMPVPDLLDGMSGIMAKVMMGGMIRKSEGLTVGDSLALLPETDKALAWKPKWAESSRQVSEALAGWSSINETIMQSHFNEQFIDMIGERVDSWFGGPALMSGYDYSGARWVFDKSDLPCAELALCTVYSPYNVTDTMLENALQSTGSTQALLTLVAWSAQRAARRCGDWTALAAKSAFS
ncbi:MAG: hypothetical protein AB8B97_28530 [Granulosicoccus sp.]